MLCYYFNASDAVKLITNDSLLVKVSLAGCKQTHRLKMATKMLQASEAFIAGLAGVRPLPSVTAQVALQVRLPLHCVCTKGAFEAHDRVGICKEE